MKVRFGGKNIYVVKMNLNLNLKLLEFLTKGRYSSFIFKNTCYLVWILVQRQRSNRELPCQVTTFLGENTQELLNQIPFIFPYSDLELHYSFQSQKWQGCKKKQNCISNHCYSIGFEQSLAIYKNLQNK